MKKTTIKGIGNDIIEVDRIRKTILRYGNHFFKKILTEKEIDYCLRHQDPVLLISGRFSAKEAIAKALGTGFGHLLSWLDIEILNDKAGKPIVSFSDGAKTQFQSPTILVSISHCKTYATAFDIWIDETTK